MDARECKENETNMFASEKNKNMTATKSGEARGERNPSILFIFIVSGTSY